MKRFYLPLLLLLLLVLEGVALDFLPQRFVSGDLMVVPHWTLVFLVLITIFYDLENTYFSVLYALVFGMIIDVVYTSVLGVYMFTYALAIYSVHGLRKFLHTNVFVALLLTAIGIGLADFAIYAIYSFIDISQMLWQQYIYVRLLPTIVANLTFLILLYPCLKPKLSAWSEERFSNNKSGL